MRILTKDFPAKIAMILTALCVFGRAYAGDEAGLSGAFASARETVRASALDRTTCLLGLHDRADKECGATAIPIRAP